MYCEIPLLVGTKVPVLCAHYIIIKFGWRRLILWYRLLENLFASAHQNDHRLLSQTTSLDISYFAWRSIFRISSNFSWFKIPSSQRRSASASSRDWKWRVRTSWIAFAILTVPQHKPGQTLNSYYKSHIVNIIDTILSW